MSPTAKVKDLESSMIRCWLDGDNQWSSLAGIVCELVIKRTQKQVHDMEAGSVLRKEGADVEKLEWLLPAREGG